jgi:hypothetical protein
MINASEQAKDLVIRCIVHVLNITISKKPQKLMRVDLAKHTPGVSV